MSMVSNIKKVRFYDLEQENFAGDSVEERGTKVDKYRVIWKLFSDGLELQAYQLFLI